MVVDFKGEVVPVIGGHSLISCAAHPASRSGKLGYPLLPKGAPMRILIAVVVGMAICTGLLLASNPGLVWRIQLRHASQETQLDVLYKVWIKAVEIDSKADGGGLRAVTPVPQSVEDAVVSIGMDYLYSNDPPTSNMAVDILCKAGRKRKDVLPALIKFASREGCDPNILASLLCRLTDWEELAAPAKTVALQNLGHISPDVRGAAVRLIDCSKAATADDLAMVRPLIRDENDDVKLFAFSALHAYGKLDDESRTELEKHTESPNFYLKRTAKRLLKGPPKVTLPTK